MTRELKLEYIEEFIKGTDDGTFESEDDLGYFVFEALVDDFGDETAELVDEAMRRRTA